MPKAAPSITAAKRHNRWEPKGASEPYKAAPKNQDKAKTKTYPGPERSKKVTRKLNTAPTAVTMLSISASLS